MTHNEIALLKDFMLTGRVSVISQDYNDCYIVPIPALIVAILEGSAQWFGQTEYTDTEDIKTYINCSYKTILGTQFIECTVLFENSDTPTEKTLIPLDQQKQNSHQRDLMSLINGCARQVISQQISRKKYAIAAAASAGIKQYH